MAASDYRLCDVCGGKAFYDSHLNHTQGEERYGIPYRVAGEPQFDTDEKCQKWGAGLDYVGDWAVICTGCSETHKCVIVPISNGATDGR